MLNLDGGQEVGVQGFRAAAIQFSRDPALPCGSFEEKRLIVNEDEPPMDTNEHKFLLNYLWKSFPPSRPLADPSRASSNPLVALRRSSCPFVDMFLPFRGSRSWISFFPGSISSGLLVPGRQVGPVAAALARSAAVVDHPVGQEGVLPRDLLNADIPLPGLRGGSAQDPVDLMPAPGRESAWSPPSRPTSPSPHRRSQDGRRSGFCPPPRC